MEWVWVLVAALRAVSPAPDDQWATRLAALDAVRAEAYASADPRLLDRVYVRGSRARADDAATLAGYRGRGGRVVGADLRILRCRVVAASARLARLEVVDRLAPARAGWADGSTTRLPRDEPSRREITLVRTPGGWRIAGAELR